MLYDFYGEECPHCVDMHPLVERLEKECGVTVVKKEVWHNDENRRELEAIDDGSLCGGVPFSHSMAISPRLDIHAKRHIVWPFLRHRVTTPEEYSHWMLTL